MSMDNIAIGTTESHSEQSANRPDMPAGLLAMAAAAQRRVTAVQPEETQRQPPEATLRLTAGSTPVARYLAGRNVRPATMVSLRGKIRLSRDLLIAAGMDSRFAEIPIEQFPWHCVDESIAQSFALLLENRYSNTKSRENLIGVVRRMLGECTKIGLLSHADRDHALECLPVKLNPRPPAGRELTEWEIRRLLKATMAGTRPIDQRDAALIAVFLSTGLRASEVAEIKIGDLDLEPDERRILVRRTKSGGSRVAFLDQFAVTMVESWLATRGDHPGALFDSINRRGGCLNPGWINELLQERARLAGIRRHFTSHDFRRTFATRALRSGVDVFTVQRLLNHKNVQTTLCYDRRTELEDRAVVDGLELPGLFPRSVGR